MTEFEHIANDLVAICFTFFNMKVLCLTLNTVCKKWHHILNSYSACWKVSTHAEYDMIRKRTKCLSPIFASKIHQIQKLVKTPLLTQAFRLALFDPHLHAVGEMLERCFPNVQTLACSLQFRFLDGAHDISKFIEKLAQLKSLTRLSLDSYLSPAHISAMTTFSQLTYLGLAMIDTHLVDSLTKLLFIPINQTQTHLPSLKTVMLFSCYRAQLAFPNANMHLLPSIQHLDLYYISRIESESPMLTANILALSIYNMTDCDRVKSIAAFLAPATNLRFLNLDCVSLNLDDFRAITTNFKLEKLHLVSSSTEVATGPDFDWSDLLNLKSTLKTFCVPNEITENLIVTLAKMTQLEYIYIQYIVPHSFSLLVDAVFLFYSNLKNLKQLHAQFPKSELLKTLNFRAKVYNCSPKTIIDLESWVEKHYFSKVTDIEFHRTHYDEMSRLNQNNCFS